MVIKKNVYLPVLFVMFLSTALMGLSVNAHAQKISMPMSKNTLANLMTAYKNEMNAHARYLAFAQKADEEGYGKAGSLFRATARAKQVHCENYSKAINELGGMPETQIEKPVVRSTKENLEKALKDETYESEQLYKTFMQEAEKDGVKSAMNYFADAKDSETVHASLYKNALNNLDAWKGEAKTFSVCPGCGYITEKIEGPSCPVCNTPTTTFMPVK